MPQRQRRCRPHHRLVRPPRVLHLVSGSRYVVFVASLGRIEARGGCRYRPPSRHRLKQSGLLTSMFYCMTTCTGRNLVYCLLFYVLTSINILTFHLFPVNKSDRPLDCHGKVNCVVSQLFSRTLTLGLLG